MHVLASPLEPNSIVVVLEGPIDRADVPELCDRVHTLLEGSDADLVICDVRALVDPDAVTVDALCRLQLIAGRLGRRVRFRDACGELRDLLVVMGLDDVLLPCAELPIQPRGEAEQREQPGRVEEERDPADPAR